MEGNPSFRHCSALNLNLNRSLSHDPEGLIQLVEELSIILIYGQSKFSLEGWTKLCVCIGTII